MDNTTRNEALYNEHIKMIQKKAWSYQCTTGIDFAELMSEGHMIFMKAVEKWDGKRTFSTFLYTCLDNGFRKFLVKADVPGDQAVLEELTSGTPAPFSRMAFRDLLDNLSAEARQVAMIILNGPAEAFEVMGTEPPKVMRGAAQRYMVKKMGLTHKRSWQVINELKQVVA